VCVGWGRGAGLYNDVVIPGVVWGWVEGVAEQQGVACHCMQPLVLHWVCKLASTVKPGALHQLNVPYTRSLEGSDPLWLRLTLHIRTYIAYLLSNPFTLASGC
jgi:hypothetical protein